MSLSLSQLKKPLGATRVRKRVGRGQASGLGKTAGRGGKGQKARSGNMRFEGFEGGQMPLQRRLPKFGFHSLFRRDLEEVQVARLEKLPAGSVVDLAALKGAGLAKGRADGLVVLGRGELKNAYTVKADRVTAGARESIEKAGGKVEILPRLQTMGEKAKVAALAERAAELAKRPPRPQKPQKPEKAEKAEQKAEQPAKGEKAKGEKAKGDKPPKTDKSPKPEKKPKEPK